MKVKVRDYISYLQNTRFKLMLVHFSGDWLCCFLLAISGNTASPGVTIYSVPEIFGSTGWRLREYSSA